LRAIAPPCTKKPFGATHVRAGSFDLRIPPPSGVKLVGIAFEYCNVISIGVGSGRVGGHHHLESFLDIPPWKRFMLIRMLDMPGGVMLPRRLWCQDGEGGYYGARLKKRDTHLTSKPESAR
jgi:hypothetical protein